MVNIRSVILFYNMQIRHEIEYGSRTFVCSCVSSQDFEEGETIYRNTENNRNG